MDVTLDLEARALACIRPACAAELRACLAGEPQRVLAERTGRPFSSVRRALAGRAPLEYLLGLAPAVGLSPAQLFERALARATRAELEGLSHD